MGTAVCIVTKIAVAKAESAISDKIEGVVNGVVENVKNEIMSKITSAIIGVANGTNGAINSIAAIRKRIVDKIKSAVDQSLEE